MFYCSAPSSSRRGWCRTPAASSVPFHPQRLEVVPFAADRALVMVMTELGTGLVRRGDHLEWTDAGGNVVHFERAR